MLYPAELRARCGDGGEPCHRADEWQGLRLSAPISNGKPKADDLTLKVVTSCTALKKIALYS